LIVITGCNLQLSSDQGVFKLSGTGAHDVWAIAGERFGARDRVLHYDGDWSEAVKFNGDNLGAIHARGASDVWVAGQHTMFHYDGSNWSSVQAPDAMVAIGDDWAVGAHGAVVERDGSSWRTLQAPLGITATAAWGASSTDLWAVVSGTVQHFDGHAWEVPPAELSANLQLSAIWGTAANDVWAAGYDSAAHYDGQHWTTMTTSAHQFVYALWGPSGSDVWATGTNDLILRNWSPMAHGQDNSVELNDIWGSSTSDVWIAGYQELDPGGRAFLRHFDGNTWKEIAAP
jgi:hypothetical protein